MFGLFSHPRSLVSGKPTAVLVQVRDLVAPINSMFVLAGPVKAEDSPTTDNDVLPTSSD